MKNKKLFAILTLVCFMMTLMPVAAFAAEVSATPTVAVASKTSINLTFDSVVSATAAAKNAFTVEDANGTDYAVNAATASNRMVTLTVADISGAVGKIVVSYVDGADYVSIGSDIVSDFTVEKAFTAPTVTKVEATAANTVVITFDQIVTGGLVTEFKKDGTALTGSDSLAVTGNKATLTLATPLTAGTAAKISYVPGTLKNAAENKNVAAFEKSVTYVAPAVPPTPDVADKGTSAIYTVKNNPTVKVDGTIKIGYELRDAAGLLADVSLPASDKVYVWFTEEGSILPSTGVKSVGGVSAAITFAGTPNFKGLFELSAAQTADNLEVVFNRAGVYTLHAATEPDFTIATAEGTIAEGMEELNRSQMKTLTTNNVVTVKGENLDSNDYTVNAGALGSAKDGETFPNVLPVDANGVATQEVSIALVDVNGDAVKGATVKLETNSSNIELSSDKVTTNALGKAAFTVSGVREGSYEIYVTCESYEATIKVQVGATSPTYIAVAKAPTAPINIDDTETLSNIVRFVITDINGNTLTSEEADDQHAFVNDVDGVYAAIVSAPAESDLTDEDVKLVNDRHVSNGLGIYSTLAIDGGFDVEGTYEFKVALDNGNSVRVTVEAKEFGTPVGIVLEYSAPSVELGGVMNTKDFLLVDKNGVTTQAAGKVELAASGYAIDNFNTTNGTITVKADEKYLGSTITVTAVSERYDLMTSASVKVVAEAAGLMFTSKTAEVNVNNAIQVVLVDAQGNRTAFGDARADRANYDINYVVLDKPEGAKVAVNTAAVDNDLLAAGSFKMNLTCDKVGTVKVQAVAKITKVAADGKDVVKYYTGIGEFAVGNGQTGKSVVMSIGSNEMIADGKVSTVDAQPMIQNNRTFVPFRALAEAFGATVAYDQATSSVTATLNGVEVVMTVGAPVYTVNGVKNTADVAPFISDSRTFVPVRFAAEAFGITVTPTYNADGSVADVLFNM